MLPKSQVVSSLSGDNAEDSFYALNNGYSSPTGSTAVAAGEAILSGTFGGSSFVRVPGGADGAAAAGLLDRLVRYDPDFTSGTTNLIVLKVAVPGQFNKDDLIAAELLTHAGVAITGSEGLHVRRLTQYSGSVANNGIYGAGDAKEDLLLVIASDTRTVAQLSASFSHSPLQLEFALADDFIAGGALGSVLGDDLWGAEQASNTVGATAGVIPEIDIKVDSVSITAITKKLKAKWTPELGQDLNAYHNLDAEVELTSILSEQIALEIDREIHRRPR